MTENSQEFLHTPELLPHSKCFVFLETTPGHTPASAYEEYCRRREEAELHHPLYYASTTITSGGYRRDESLGIGKAIESNSRLARQIVDEGFLERGVEPALIVLPSELGKVKGWRQTDYLQFWMYIIRAVHPDSAHQLELGYFRNPNSNLNDIGELMESAPTAEERRQAYIAFVREYMAIKDSSAKDLLTPHWQAPVVLPIFDNEMSLGCSAEYYFAETLLPSWGFFPQSPNLKEEVARLIGSGAMIAGY